MGLFPFGWVRNHRKDNWQIVWDSGSGVVFVKSAISKEKYDTAGFTDWIDAKQFADKLLSDPAVFNKIISKKKND